jgi:hypothetical protein
MDEPYLDAPLVLSDVVMDTVSDLLLQLLLEEEAGTSPPERPRMPDPPPPARQWAAEQNAQGRLCACGCGGKVLVLPRHRSTGAPRFVHGHHRRKNRPPAALPADRGESHGQVTASPLRAL